MSITDELREWARGFENVWFKPASKEIIVTTGTSMPVDHVNMRLFIEEMLDRIDAEHESKVSYWQGASYKDGYDEGFASADDWLAQHEDAMAEHGWVKLPVDADGVPIHVGDVVIAQLLFGGESKPLVVDRMELSRGRDGDLWCVALDNDKGCWNQPSVLRHHHPPTVEDVLREMVAAYMDTPLDDSNDGEFFAEYAAKLRLAGED